MHDWPLVTSSEIPSPKLVAAWVALNLVPTERVPLWAAHWLVVGYDGEALRTLAGFNGADPHEVHDVLPDALADCGTPIPDSDEAEAQIAFTHLARMHAEGNAGERWITEKVDEFLDRTGYARSAIGLPLGQLYELADEWRAGWGRSDQQLAAEVQDACAAQLAMSLAAPPSPSPDDGPGN
jgi:hypothetical protein